MEPEIETLHLIKCSHCGKEKVFSMEDVPTGLFLFRIYTEAGWTWDRWLPAWFCEECTPEKFKKDVMCHPRYYDYLDDWDPKPEKRSHDFEHEVYDPYARSIQGKMCECCEFMKLGYEDDGSNWMMCVVDDPENRYGHNLYSGHFYGPAIEGRLCPYFRCGTHVGRDPKQDKENGTFHVPYQECYDGD